MRSPLLPFIVIIFLSTQRLVFAADKVEQFAAKYSKAKSEKKKREVCIKLIDSDLLYVGSDVNDLRKVFKNDFEEMGMGSSSNLLAMVHFQKLEIPSIPGAVATWTGWYLFVTYMQDGVVVDYGLSNESKHTSARLLYEKQSKSGTNKDVGLPMIEPPRSPPLQK